MTELIVVWAGARDHYLDDALNVRVERPNAAVREFLGRARGDERRQDAVSMRVTLVANISTSEWRTMAVLFRLAGLTPSYNEISNAANSLTALWRRGEVERRRKESVQLGERRSFEYRLKVSA